MEKLTKLKSFIFDVAQYEIEDKFGNKGTLKVNYKNKSYEIEGITDIEAYEELSLFAQTILDRKHGVNFVS